MRKMKLDFVSEGRTAISPMVRRHLKDEKENTAII